MPMPTVTPLEGGLKESVLYSYVVSLYVSFISDILNFPGKVVVV